MRAGERLVIRTAGGGGFGDPKARPAAEILSDVENGKVSAAAAQASYGAG